MSQYSTNLTDRQWQVTEIILDPQHRKRKYPLREIMNAIMEKPRARDPLHRRGVTPCAVFRLTLCADNKMTPAGAVPAGDFFCSFSIRPGRRGNQNYKKT